MRDHQKVLDMAYLALLIAIMLILGLVPFLGFIPLGFASVTILHLPVIVAVLYFDWKMATLSGLAFGLISWIVALWRPTQPLDPFFQNPLISVLPRVLFGLFASLLYTSLKKWIKNRHLHDIVSALLASFIHSVLVLALLASIYYGQVTEAGTFKAAVMAALVTLGTASVLEALAAALIAPPIANALRAVNHKEETLNIIEIED